MRLTPPKTSQSDHGVDSTPLHVHTLRANSSPPAWVSTMGGRGERRVRRQKGERRWGGGITWPNLCRPQLGALSRSQRVAEWKSPWGHSQALASPPLSSVHLSPSQSNNPPRGTSLPPSTFFLPPLPPGGAGEVVLEGSPRRAGSGEYRCHNLHVGAARLISELLKKKKEEYCVSINKCFCCFYFCIFIPAHLFQYFCITSADHYIRCSINRHQLWESNTEIVTCFHPMYVFKPFSQPNIGRTSKKPVAHLTDRNGKYVIILWRGLVGPFQWVHPCQGDVWMQ